MGGIGGPMMMGAERTPRGIGCLLLVVLTWIEGSARAQLRAPLGTFRRKAAMAWVVTALMVCSVGGCVRVVVFCGLVGRNVDRREFVARRHFSSF